MEAVVFEDSPLAEYLEGKAPTQGHSLQPFTTLTRLTGEGDIEEEWAPAKVPQQATYTSKIDHTTKCYSCSDP